MKLLRGRNRCQRFFCLEEGGEGEIGWKERKRGKDEGKSGENCLNHFYLLLMSELRGNTSLYFYVCHTYLLYSSV